MPKPSSNVIFRAVNEIRIVQRRVYHRLPRGFIDLLLPFQFQLFSTLYSTSLERMTVATKVIHCSLLVPDQNKCVNIAQQSVILLLFTTNPVRDISRWAMWLIDKGIRAIMTWRGVRKRTIWRGLKSVRWGRLSYAARSVPPRQLASQFIYATHYQWSTLLCKRTMLT